MILKLLYVRAFNDFALEFYNFVADNYAPYFSLPHECSDRDAPFVLDGPLSVLLEKKDRTLHPEWIAEEWDRMGHFNASPESGHATAFTAIRRLNGFTGKNHFYTEYTLAFLSDKGEQIHALARDLKYGHRGRLNSRDWLQQKNSCSCLTLVIACIIYWQAKEIHCVIQSNTPPDNVDLSLLSNISPVSWDNVILYGDYILNRSRVVV